MWQMAKTFFSYSQHNNAYSINCGVLLGELAWMGTLFICTRNLLFELQLDMEWNNMLGMTNKMEHQTSGSMFGLHDLTASLLCWNLFPCRRVWVIFHALTYHIGMIHQRCSLMISHFRIDSFPLKIVSVHKHWDGCAHCLYPFIMFLPMPMPLPLPLNNNSGLGQETLLHFEGAMDRIFTCWSNMNSNKLKRMHGITSNSWV